MRYPPGRARLRPPLTPGVAWLIGLELGFFLLYLFAGDGARAFLYRWLVLTPDGLASGHLWKLATSALINVDPAGQVRVLGVFFDILVLWLFVPVIERTWDTRRFVRFVATATITANLLAALVGLAVAPGYPVSGLSPFIFSTFIVFGLLYANERVQFFGVVPIRGRSLAIGMVVFVTVLLVAQLAGGQLTALMDGAGYYSAMAIAYVTTRGIAWEPRAWWLRHRRRRQRRRYQVLEGGAGKDERDRKHWIN